jgi:hypothetical protein
VTQLQKEERLAAMWSDPSNNNNNAEKKREESTDNRYHTSEPVTPSGQHQVPGLYLVVSPFADREETPVGGTNLNIQRIEL